MYAYYSIPSTPPSKPTVRDPTGPTQPLAAIYSYVTRHNVTDTYVHYHQSVVPGW